MRKTPKLPPLSSQSKGFFNRLWFYVKKGLIRLITKNILQLLVIAATLYAAHHTANNLFENIKLEQKMTREHTLITERVELLAKLQAEFTAGKIFRLINELQNNERPDEIINWYESVDRITFMYLVIGTNEQANINAKIIANLEKTKQDIAYIHRSNVSGISIPPHKLKDEIGLCLKNFYLDSMDDLTKLTWMTREDLQAIYGDGIDRFTVSSELKDLYEEIMTVRDNNMKQEFKHTNASSRCYREKKN